MHAVPAAGYTGELAARAETLREQAAAAIADPPPPEEVLWLAEQLADVGRLLGRAARAGTIAADAYEAGRLDERAHRPRGTARTLPA